MKKISVIFDDTTIINFHYLFKIMKRYFALLVVAPLVAIGFISYFYLVQKDIYKSHVYFKVVSNESGNTATGAIASLIGEKTSQLSPSEAIGFSKSQDFTLELAETLYDSEVYKSLNYNGILSKKQKSFEVIFGHCEGNKKCFVEKAAKILPTFWSIKQDHIVEGQFQLIVQTLDNFTTEVVLRELSKLMMAHRAESIKLSMQNQRQVTESLIKKKKDELDGKNILEIKKKVDELTDNLRISTQKMQALEKAYNVNKWKMSSIKASLDVTKTVLGKTGRDSNSEKYKQFRKLKDKKEKLVQDIAAIRYASESVTIGDKQILTQLKRELRDVKRKLAKLGNVERSVGSVDDFLEKKGSQSNDRRFEFKVLKKEVRKIESELKKEKDNRDTILEQKRNLELDLEKWQPAFQYIKLLEQKLMQLNLIEATVVSDIMFNDRVSSIKRYKRNTLPKVIAFSTVLTFFGYLIILMLFYLFDSRIYDEFELTQNFEDLEVIGQTPEFH